MRPIIFITGIGTAVGKTIMSSIVCEALKSDYCKPVQAGLAEKTDSQLLSSLLSNTESKVHPELFRLKLPASPHIAAREEGIRLEVSEITAYLYQIKFSGFRPLVVEGAGGLLVPLNERETMLDLITALKAKVIIVSRNYLGSINHSLLTARALQQVNANVAGWIFNDHFMDYESEIVEWTQIPSLGSVPFVHTADKQFIFQQASLIKENLLRII